MDPCGSLRKSHTPCSWRGTRTGGCLAAPSISWISSRARASRLRWRDNSAARASTPHGAPDADAAAGPGGAGGRGGVSTPLNEMECTFVQLCHPCVQRRRLAGF